VSTNKVWNTESESEIPMVAKEVLAALGEENLLLLAGDLGSGKTTFVKEICNQLKVKDLVNSPTYSIVNQYSYNDHKVIYHFDLYRLEREELYDLGFEEYLDKGDLILIEWPAVAMEFFPFDSCLLKITSDGDKREYSLSTLNNKLK